MSGRPGLGLRSALALLVACCAPSGTTNQAADQDYANIAAPYKEAQALKESASAQANLEAVVADLQAENKRLRKRRERPALPLPEHVSEPARDAAVRCLDDYCPCEESGTVDRMLCRNMRAGLDVDDDLLASGAAQRDARDYMRRWNRDHPEQAVP